MTESLKARLDRIERVGALQQALIDRLSRAVIAQHGILAALAEAVEPETHQRAPQALSTLN